MEEHTHSVSAHAKSANKYTSIRDISAQHAAEAGEADEQICESRVGTVGTNAWGVRKVAWIGGVFIVCTVIGALVFGWSSAAKSPGSTSLTRLQEDRAIYFLKSNLSSFYLHVSSGSMSNGDPVFQTDSTTDGSKWQVEYVGDSDTVIMLKNLRSSDYLHVKDESKSLDDPVFHLDSTSDGSKWEIEYIPPRGSGSLYVPPSGTMIMLKSVRSGFYLHATPRSKKTCCDPVLQNDSVTDGSMWLLLSPESTTRPFEPSPDPPELFTPVPSPDPTAVFTPAPSPDPTAVTPPAPSPDPTAIAPPAPSPDPTAVGTPAPTVDMQALADLEEDVRENAEAIDDIRAELKGHGKDEAPMPAPTPASPMPSPGPSADGTPAPTVDMQALADLERDVRKNAEAIDEIRAELLAIDEAPMPAPTPAS